MKRLLVVLLSAALMVFGLTTLAVAGSGAGTGIKGSFHDLSSTGASSIWGDSTEHAGLDRVCVYCHTPHHALKPAVAATGTNPTNYVPLWNHAITTTATWTVYTPGTDLPGAGTAKYPEATFSNTTPGSVSILCLSCHDGSVAVNEYGFAPASADEKRRGASSGGFPSTHRAAIGFGGDLSNHHPIGFDYTSVCKTGPGCSGNDDEIASPDTAIPGVGTIDSLLVGGKMQCSSCHDVHNTKAQGAKLTWVSDSQSGLCLTCHLKNQ